MEPIVSHSEKVSTGEEEMIASDFAPRVIAT